MPVKFAKIISIVFHPVLLPSLGFLVLLNSDFYYSALAPEAKRYLLLVFFFNTATLPMLGIALLALNSKFDIKMTGHRERAIPLLLAAVFYYLGFVLLNNIRFFPVFKLFMLAAVVLIVLLLIISMKWKISIHLAAAGAVTATVLALSFRTGANPVFSIVALVLVSGLLGTSRLALNKHSLQQIIAGYALGFSVLYPVIYFV